METCEKTTYDKQYHVNDKVSTMHRVNNTKAFPVKLGIKATISVMNRVDKYVILDTLLDS